MNDNTHNPELIQKFVEAYNREIDWNIELRQELGLNGCSFRPCAKEILDGYIDTEYITAENYDLENADIYAGDKKPGQYELQTYSYERYCTSYFWTNFNETKEEYKAGRIQAIRKEIENQRSWRQPKLDELQADMNVLVSLENIIK